MSGALDDTRVVDFGQYLAGPLALLLADQGADEVIRVDPPGGPRWRHPANAVLQRGKRTIVLDLKRSNDLTVARDLVASADVVIENFRPGVMERLGLGPLATSERHPRLIFCSLGLRSRRSARRSCRLGGSCIGCRRIVLPDQRFLFPSEGAAAAGSPARGPRAARTRWGHSE
jgi:hypothetical protein